MRRVSALAIAVCCTFAVCGTVLADQSNTGCGVGTMIFEGKDGLLSQVSAATTNGTFGNQTFGITSGTVNCTRAEKFVSYERLNKFVGENMDNLAVDMSKGSGEYLSTLAVLLDVPEAQRPELYGRLQSNFSKIYTSDDVTHLDVLNNLEAVLATN